MSENIPEFANSTNGWDDTNGGTACLADFPLSHAEASAFGYAASAAASPIQFARSIEALSPRLVGRFVAGGLEEAKAGLLAREFTRKLATVFYALDIQPFNAESVGALSGQARCAAPIPYTLALYALLPDLIRLCAGGESAVPVLRKAASPVVLKDEYRRRLLVLATLVGCLRRPEMPGSGFVSAAEKLAESLVCWAREEMAVSLLPAGVMISRKWDN